MTTLFRSDQMGDEWREVERSRIADEGFDTRPVNTCVGQVRSQRIDLCRVDINRDHMYVGLVK